MSHVLEPSTASTTTDADSNGDVIFVVGQDNSEQKSIRVSSKVMSLASPAAMFSPRWSESADKPPSAHTRQMPLLEDDPMAMAWICQTLHFRKYVSTNISVSSLGDIATVCDKYDLGVALKLWGEMCLQCLQELVWDAESEEDIVTLKWIWSVFDNSEMFWYSSWKLLYYHPKPISSLDGHQISGVATSLLKDNTFGKHHTRTALPLPDFQPLLTEDLTQNTILEVYTMLEDVITPLLTNNGDPITIYHHLQELRGIGFWPLSEKFQQVPIRGVEEKLGFYQACKRDDCRCSTVGLQHLINQIADTLRKQRGLCLKCYKVEEGLAGFG